MKLLTKLLFNYDVAYRNLVERDDIDPDLMRVYNFQYEILKCGAGTRRRINQATVEKVASRVLQVLCRSGQPVDVKELKELIHWTLRVTGFKTPEVLGIPKAYLPRRMYWNLSYVLTSAMFTTNQLTEYFNRRYVYIFLRQDMSVEQQIVQASHVPLALGQQLDDTRELYFSVIGTPNLEGLDGIINHLVHEHVAYKTFFEPDMNNEYTAVATFPIKAYARGSLLKYRPLRFK